MADNLPPSVAAESTGDPLETLERVLAGEHQMPLEELQLTVLPELRSMVTRMASQREAAARQVQATATALQEAREALATFQAGEAAEAVSGNSQGDSAQRSDVRTEIDTLVHALRGALEAQRSSGKSGGMPLPRPALPPKFGGEPHKLTDWLQTMNL